MQLFPEDILPPAEQPAAEPVPPPKKKPKKETKIRIVYREPEVSDRQKLYQIFLKEAVIVKRRDYQKWATHVTVQSSKVFTAAAQLMETAMLFKELRPETTEEFETKVELAHKMKSKAIETMATAIRFLERLKIPEYGKEDIQEPLEQQPGEQQGQEEPPYSSGEAWAYDGVDPDETGEYRDNGIPGAAERPVYTGEDKNVLGNIFEPMPAGAEPDISGGYSDGPLPGVPV